MTTARVGLYIGAWGVAEALARGVGTLTAGVLRDALGVFSGNPLTGYLGVFVVQAGLLERSEDPADRRVKQLRLTEKGRKLVETGMAERYSWVDALVARLEPAEREKVAEAMNILTGAIQQVIEQDKSVME